MRRIILLIFALAVVSVSLWVFAESYTVPSQVTVVSEGGVYNLETGEVTRFYRVDHYIELIKPYQHLSSVFSAVAIIASVALCGLIAFKKLGLKITVSRNCYS